MAKLARATLEKMAAALTRHKLNDSAEKLRRESVDLFNAVLDDHYDEATRKLIAQLEKKHRGAFSKVDDVYVNVSGRRIRVGAHTIGSLRGNYGSGWRIECESRPLLSCDTGYDRIYYLEGPLADRLIAFGDAVEALRNDGEASYRKALGALSQFSTGKRLAEGWPEAIPVIGNLIPEDDRALPVVQVAALNSEFELPPEMAMAA